MGIPTWVTGQVLTASDVDTWFVPLSSVKGSDQTVTSSTALVNDTALVLAAAANATYKFDCLVIYTGATGGDIQWTWAVPSGATLLYQCLHNEGGGTGLNNSHLVNTAGFTGLGAASGGTTNIGLGMTGTFQTSSTAGNLQLRWAQNASNATPTTVRALSSIMLRRTG